MKIDPVVVLTKFELLDELLELELYGNVKPLLQLAPAQLEAQTRS